MGGKEGVRGKKKGREGVVSQARLESDRRLREEGGRCQLSSKLIIRELFIPVQTQIATMVSIVQVL